MIEVQNVDFLGGKDPKNLLREEMTPVVRILSEQDGQSMRVRVVYLATSKDTEYDQILCDETVENIPEGVVEFDLPCKMPEISKIPKEYILGLTSIVVICYTKEGKEFARVGYFVKVDYPGVHIEEKDSASENEEEEMGECDKDSEDEKNSEPEDEESDALSADKNEYESTESEAEEAEEAKEGEEEVEAIEKKDGKEVEVMSLEEFCKMEIDYQKVEAQLLEPPLVTIFTEAWFSNATA